MASVINGPLHVTEGLTCDTFHAPANSIGDAAINASDPITTEKVKHLHMVCGGQMDSMSAYDEIRPIYIAFTSGTVQQFQGGIRVPPVGDSTLKVKLYKNGVNILSADVDISTAFTPDAYDQVVAGIEPTLADYSPGDVFEVVVVNTPGTGTPPEGLFFQAAFNEGVY